MKALDAWLPAVNKILYLLFTEGYLASHTGMPFGVSSVMKR